MSGVYDVLVSTDFLCKPRKRWLVSQVNGQVPVYWCQREHVFFSHYGGSEYRCPAVEPLIGTIRSSFEDDSELTYAKYIGFNLDAYSPQDRTSASIQFEFYRYEMAEREDGRKFFRPFASRGKGEIRNVYGTIRCLYTTELWAELNHFKEDLGKICQTIKFTNNLLIDPNVKYTHEHILHRLKGIREGGY